MRPWVLEFNRNPSCDQQLYSPKIWDPSWPGLAIGVGGATFYIELRGVACGSEKEVIYDLMAPFARRFSWEVMVVCSFGELLVHTCLSRRICMGASCAWRCRLGRFVLCIRNGPGGGVIGVAIFSLLEHSVHFHCRVCHMTSSWTSSFRGGHHEKVPL